MTPGIIATPMRRLAPAQSPGASGADFRPDIQGLRAVAVVVVILEHFFHWPTGGFVGVDVFFVISGFLITDLLLKEHDRTGHISFASFYRRRVRRIMPLAVLVLVSTYLASSLLFLGERVRSTAWDALWAGLFAANWRFASAGTDYWQTDGPVSPLRHYWSLSVEEQFYLVWPVLLVLVLGLAGQARDGSPSRWAVGAVLGAVFVGSIGFAFWEVSRHPTVAYFSAFSRAWELGAGALLALATPWLARIPAPARPALQWLGLVGLVISVVTVTAQTPFPVPGAFLPVVSAALVIAGGVGGQRLMFPLTNRAARYVGDISYSLYLWHFPLLVLISAALPGGGYAVPLLALGGTALLSVLSYQLVEDPIRRSAWLESRQAGATGRRGGALIRRTAGLVALAATVTAIVTVAVRSPSPTVPAETVAVTSQDELAVQIRTALNASAWPVLAPPVGELGRLGFSRGDGRGCRPAPPDGNDCAVPPAPRPRRLAVVVGDSIGTAWLPMVREALEPAGWVVQDRTYAGCPFLAADTVSRIDSITRFCPRHRETVRRLITELEPELVIVSNGYRQRFAGNGGNPSLPEWERAARTAKEEWLAAAGKVVAIQPPPVGLDPKTCITRISVPQDCVSTLSAEYSSYQEADRRVWSGGGSWHLATTDWFCVSERCPIFVGGVIVRRDGNHVTAEYARKLVPLFEDALAPVLTNTTD